MEGHARVRDYRTARPALLLLALAAALCAPVRVLAHGSAPPPPDLPGVLLAWPSEPGVWLALAIAAFGCLALVRRVDGGHPHNKVPRRRLAAWFAGLFALALALASPVEAYATTLFSVHMLQHLLLTMVAAPLLLLSAPVTLLLRAASPGGRRRVLLPLLHSRVVRTIAFPPLAWVLFTAVMWMSHFSPLFDAALEDPTIHVLEHALFLGSALLFWWPVAGVDPSPWRIGHGGRIAYLGLAMPQNTFLAVALTSASTVLYPHYATLERAWGPSPLEDQQMGAAIMWLAGDLVLLVGVLAAMAAWFRAEEERGRRLDARLARERSAGERVGSAASGSGGQASGT